MTWQRPDEAPPVERAGGAEPLGYYARGARISGTDEQGRLMYRIFADRLDELPGEELLELTGVKVDYQPADETAWTLTAASAKYAWNHAVTLGDRRHISAGGFPLSQAVENSRRS